MFTFLLRFLRSLRDEEEGGRGGREDVEERRLLKTDGMIGVIEDAKFKRREALADLAKSVAKQ
jgi:hypothetical protein